MALPISYNFRNLRVRWQVTLLAIVGIALVVAVFIVLDCDGRRLPHRAPSDRLARQRHRHCSAASTVGADARASAQRQRKLIVGRQPRAARRHRASRWPRRRCSIVRRILKRIGDGQRSQRHAARRHADGVRGARRTSRSSRAASSSPGSTRSIVGRSAAERYQGLEVGGAIKLQRKDWQIVGVFTSDGSGFESEIWGDVDVMAPAFNRAGGYQSLTLRLADPSAVRRVQRRARRPTRSMQVQMGASGQFYDEQAGQTGDGADDAGHLRGRHHGRSARCSAR